MGLDEIENRQLALSFNEKIDYAIVLGCGGIGSWVALNLALSGRINSLILVDFDTIEESNLNRTPYRFCDIDKNKVDALKNIILERRCLQILTYNQRTNEQLSKTIYEKVYEHKCNYSVIVDCRDDIYNDFYNFNCKYYKLGYDGCSITIDGNPKETHVWGQSNGYAFTPSFLCPAQLLANIVVNDIVLDQSENKEIEKYNCDADGRLNDCFTLDTQNILYKLNMISKKEY